VGCAAPASDPSYVSANGQNLQATVYWSSSNPVLILRKTAAFAGEKPTDGTTYTAGNTGGSLGTGVVQFVGSATELLQTSLANATTYYYKVFSNAASCYSPGIAIDTTPAAPVATQWSYATTAASMAPPGLDPWSNVVVSGSNDDYFHSMADANGTRASGFAPFPTGGPIQSRPSILPAGYRTPAGSGVNIAYVSSQDGFLYAVNSATGAQVWKSASLGTTLQGGAGVWIQALKPLTFTGGVTSDVVFVGTSNTGNAINNKVYALNGAAAAAGGGTIVWTFAPGNMDIISSTPYVDYTNNVVWVTSRAAGGIGQPSVWKLNASTGALAGGTATWTFNDVDSSPVPNADGAFIYVGTNAGTLKAIKVSDGTFSSHTPSSGAGAIKGMPWPLSWVSASVGSPDQIIFSRTATVHSVSFDGSTFTPTSAWGSGTGVVQLTGTPTVSAPVDDGAGNLYIGGSDGKVHRLLVSNGSDAAQMPATGVSGTMGDPTFNWDTSSIHVGATNGHIYTYTTPF